jgi:hypothetical protein
MARPPARRPRRPRAARRRGSTPRREGRQRLGCPVQLGRPRRQGSVRPDEGHVPADSTGSVDGLLAAMQSWPGFEVGAPRSVTVGGVPGKQVAVTFTETTATYPDPVVWQTPQGTGFNGYPMVGAHPKGFTATFQLVDVGGKLLAIRTTDFPQMTATELNQGLASNPKRHSADQQTCTRSWTRSGSATAPDRHLANPAGSRSPPRHSAVSARRGSDAWRPRTDSNRRRQP